MCWQTVVDESYPLKGKVPRVAFEKEVRSFNNAGLETVIVRPGWYFFFHYSIAHWLVVLWFFFVIVCLVAFGVALDVVQGIRSRCGSVHSGLVQGQCKG